MDKAGEERSDHFEESRLPKWSQYSPSDGLRRCRASTCPCGREDPALDDTGTNDDVLSLLVILAPELAPVSTAVSRCCALVDHLEDSSTECAGLCLVDSNSSLTACCLMEQ